MARTVLLSLSWISTFRDGSIRAFSSRSLFLLEADAVDHPYSDQLVKLTTVDPPVMVRITRITADYGLLRTVPETRNYHSYRGEEYIDLQPDGNSFDLMAGLIKTKT